jgi:hypothetical protein
MCRADFAFWKEATFYQDTLKVHLARAAFDGFFLAEEESVLLV